MILAPVALFVFNRPKHTLATLRALSRNALAKDSNIIVFSDGPRNASDLAAVQEVRKLVKQDWGFKSLELRENSNNRGLAFSIINGVSEVIEEFGQIIVLEDDLVTSPYFLKFMNEGLEIYRDEEMVASVSGYLYPVKGRVPGSFFLRGADCWGWAAWKRSWDHFQPNGEILLEQLEQRNLLEEFDLGGAHARTQMLRDQIAKRNSSWAIRWHAAIFLKGMLTLYPGVSHVKNIGFDNSGTHSGEGDGYDCALAKTWGDLEKILPIEDKEMTQKIAVFFRKLSAPGRSERFRMRWRQIRTFFSH